MKNISSRENFIQKVYEYHQGIEDYIGMIDYTMLNTDASVLDIVELCKRAKEYGVATVCVRPHMVKLAKDNLQGSDVGVTTVISFPEGTNSLESKISETKKAISDGADDIDMVMNYQYLLDNRDDYDTRMLVLEVESLVKVCHDNNKILKVIVESGRLTLELTKISTYICLEAGANFIKTSTGMVEVGAELDKVKMMYDTIKKQGSDMLIKASGGIRTFEDIKKFAPYVDRFGVGSGSIDKMMGKISGESSY